MKRFAQVMTFVVVLCIAPSIFAQPATAQEGEPGGGGMQRVFFEIDYFSYRAAFKLADGSDALLIRSAYKINFLYQHHHPTLNEHYMTATIGFYFGKTLLGRSLVENLSFEEIAFYPKWQDSAGYSHDLFLDTPVFSISGSLNDGQMVSDSLLIDNDAISQYLPMFGGYLVITGLRFNLIDGSQVAFNDTFYIELEKYSNDRYPRNATLTGEDVDFNVANGYVNILNVGPAQSVALLDLVLGIVMIGTAGIVVVLGALHIKGRITIHIFSRIATTVREIHQPLKARAE